MRKGLMAIGAAIALAVTGCSSLGGSSTAAVPPAQASSHNQADVKFAQDMIPHHQQTIQMADLATRQATGQKVKIVAASVLSAEEKEIQMMKGWLTQWKAAHPDAAKHGGHDMPGMISTSDMTALEAMSGAAFDSQWLSMIEKHLESGVTMSKTVLAEGQSAEAKAMANEIIENQEAKIKEVQALG
ncbi:DUF305 domain-containing protein [Kibdelosporangium philippinense]|uniref:DUF305 domain-containing protein n=1 Tax=Kibdelosporangium philippinense TaxID=211113 RepID=A0ABS8ZAS4_9PSEU|nr:DUF305 domain-containing protein [Kibdelosporangium philippinense]MCE7004507.1 DUF305 domain-containing protein [Kibdelosporangium philippinense]